jgi:NAD(P)-dependent dehydrogenase (short-subunit alcohol dehydrogenase family)
MSERLAIVTGTSSGIGAAVARQLLERRWQVMGIARRAVKLGDGYRHLALDLADAAAAASVIERECGARLGERAWERVALVNNAAVALPGRIENVDAVELARTLTVNVAMPLWLMGFVLKRRPRGAEVRVLNVSSGAAHRGVPGLAAYCASKAALRIAGMAVAAEVEEALAIYAYEPGVVDTDMQREAREQTPEEFPSVALFRQYHAEGRLAAPDLPAADVVKFLESERAERFTEGRRS